MIAAARAANFSSRVQPSRPSPASPSGDRALRVDRPCSSAALTVSPAPIVSTTSTFSPGTGYTVPSFVNAERPSPPWVITTAEGPASSHSRGVPPSHSASSSDSLRRFTYGSQLLNRAR